jgi:zinc protease
MTFAQLLKAAVDHPESIPPAPHDVKLIRLDNGLHIIVREDHSAPVVSAQAWCATGSIHEGRWLGAGLSHILEHMLFKGTTTRGAGRIDQEVQEAGGSMNAYTSFDRTVYYINVPNTGARVAIDILCDIMQNAALPPDELAREMDVIRREMDMGLDDPHVRSSRRLFEAAYTRSPYRFSVIGNLDVFNQIQPDDIRAYYRERYVPNNIFFVVVGDVSAADVESQIREAYKGVVEKPLPPVVLPEEPRQIAPRVVVEEASIELGHTHVSWHIPDVRHPDIPVLDVLATLLGIGRSSRLYREVREKKALVNSVDAWTYNPGNPGLFGMSAVVDADKFEAAREAMLAEVERLKAVPVSEDELGKARKQFIACTLSSRKTMQGQANDLGSGWLAAGDLNFSARFLAAVQRITPADLQRVARQYLTPENRTLYGLLPNGATPRTSVSVTSEEEIPMRKFDMSNGLRLLVKEGHKLPFVEFRFALRGGVLAETAANNGMTQMMSRMLLQGTSTRSSEQIASEIESVGGSIDSFGGNNSFGVSAEVLSDDFELGLNLAADVLLRPTFPADALEREREIQLAAIAAQRDDMLRESIQIMRRKLFGGAGYGLDSLGTEESVRALQCADLHVFHQRLTAPNNCVMAVCGDVQTDAVVRAVERIFGSWKQANVATGLSQPPPQLSGIHRITETRDKKQAVVIVGFPGGSLLTHDRFALELLQESCSDLGSRLFMRIRDKLGLAYYTGAINFLGLVPGYFAFYAGTEAGKAAQVEEEMLREAGLLRTEGLTEAELKRAKAKIIGQKKIARQELSHQAMAAALDELYGLGFAQGDIEDAEYESVTLDEIKAAAVKYLNPEARVVSIIQPQA